MTRTKSIATSILIMLVLCTVFILTGPWKTRDEQQFDDIRARTTHTALLQGSPSKPETVSRYLQSLPITVLNLSELRAGPGVTLANPVQPFLIIIAAKDSGSTITVLQRPDRPLRPSIRHAIIACVR